MLLHLQTGNLGKALPVVYIRRGATIEELKAELARGDGLQRLKEMLLAESALGYLMEINT